MRQKLEYIHCNQAWQGCVDVPIHQRCSSAWDYAGGRRVDSGETRLVAGEGRERPPMRSHAGAWERETGGECLRFLVTPVDDASFRQILHFFDLSWRGYRRVRKGVEKRIARHMHACGRRTIGDYQLLLREDPDAAKKARELLTVSISRFARDVRLWEIMGELLIPELVRETEQAGGGPVRAWSAGCACGEEVYSLKILWDQAGKRFVAMPPLEVWATDTNPEVLEKARIGVYPASSLKNLAPSSLKGYFIEVAGGFSIREELKGGIHWVDHDFISEAPPEMNFDIVLLRNNLLTYYGPPARTRAFSRIVAAVRAGGFLIIGNNEEISIEGASLKSRAEYRCIFEKTPDPSLGRKTGTA